MRFKHKLRWYIDPWYRRRIRAYNKTFKQHFLPIIIDGLYTPNRLIEMLKDSDDQR